MILGDVLRTLSNYCRVLGMDHNDLYVLLFEEEDLNLNQTVKNAFKERGLSQRIYKRLLTDEGFVHLTKIINNKLLSAIGNHAALYQELYQLVSEDTHFSDDEKLLVLSSFHPGKQSQLAQLIALCIICGNYNLPEKKSLHVNHPINYGINLEKFTSNAGSLLLEHELWKASQRDFFASRRAGGRFSSLNIITQLLPKGFIAEPDFLIKGKTENGTVRNVMELCSESTEHIAVIGNGGIGKTTFLHQLMTEAFAQKSDSKENPFQPLPYQTGRAVPFFIELNRCPENIGSWYEDSLHKTNFITRYVAQILENHASLASVSPKSLDSIEKEFQKVPENGSPRYLLLLDGFNEVKSSQAHSVRTYLSNEISVLSHYPNVRIITTSRETQAAYYASDFENIRLVGLEEADIVDYLKKCGISDTQTGLIMACKPLIECLRIPLYLCMFCAENTDTVLPQTSGEILYNFFHKNSSIYNIRSRASDTRTNPLEPQQTAFVLDFILPYIGWRMEKDDCFSIRESDLKEMIETAVFSITSFCRELKTIPYIDFHYRPTELISTAKSLTGPSAKQLLDPGMLQRIVDCMYSHLGIIYHYQTNEYNFCDRNRYAFAHHQFRDYFSAMWDLQLLTLIQCMDEQNFFRCYPYREAEISCTDYLNTHYWQNHKAEFISQILMEHRNKPFLNPQTQNWYLPKPERDEQKVLTHVLTFCRNLTNRDIHYLLQNVLSAILKGRKELSGIDLSDLNLTGCNLFNVTCSRIGKSTTLAANFQRTILEQRSFEPESHQDNVIDYLYNGTECFTLDDNGRLKCWDILSGKMEYEYQFPDPTGINDFSSSGFLKISPDGKWLAAKIQESCADGMHIGIQLLKLDDSKRQTLQFMLDHTNTKALHYFAFTGDSKGILLLTDYQNICCISLPDLETAFAFTCPDLMKNSQLYAETTSSSIHVFTAEYNLYTSIDSIDEIEDWDSQEEENGEANIGVPCQICKLHPKSKQLHTMQSFVSTPQSEPTAAYIPQKNAFLYYDYTARAIVYYDCESKKVQRVLQDLTAENPFQPSYIHVRPEYPEECYIMYPDNCYLIDLQNPENISIIMKYPVAGLHKLLKETEQEGELYFKTEVIPGHNRFLVSNDTTTYEWNSEEDTLLPRYNLLYYSCSGLIADTLHKQFILVHMHNGVSVFAGVPPVLKNAFCFEAPDYYISSCCYCASRQLLALTFARSDHEKVMTLNLSDSEERTVFSTMELYETIENINFSKNGKYLLIATTYRCCEYAIDDHELSAIRTALDEERIAGADYQENDIEVVITQNRKEQKITVQDRCEKYQRHRYRKKSTYSYQGYYLLPELTDSLTPYFIFQHGDLGVQGPVDENGMQEYWITSGFFPTFQKEDVKLPVLEAFTEIGKKISLKISPCQHIYFKHRKALEYQYRQKDTGFSYSFLDEDSGKAIFMKNSESIFYHSHYRDCSYEELRDGLSRNLGSYGGKSYWDYAVPYGKNQMLMCYENYKLMVLDTSTSEELYYIPYTPGLAVYGCNFHKAKADNELQEMLKQNGGLI